MNGQTRANIRSGFRLRVQSPGGVGGLRPLPSSYCAISGTSRSSAATTRRDAGVPESPSGEGPRAARGAGRAQQLVLRQEVGELTLPGGYSLRHAGRVRLPTHRVLAALRPERLTRRADAHTTFLAAREACYPAAGRHQRVSPTLGETLCWTSCPSTEDKKSVGTNFVSARRAFRAVKKNFFPEVWKKNFFSPEKISASEIFFRARPEKISATEIFPESLVV